MNRKQALACIKATGARGDRKDLTRLYIENRVSLPAARAAFEEGQRFGAFVRSRDAAVRS